jgi:hypothetical protein
MFKREVLNWTNKIPQNTVVTAMTRNVKCHIFQVIFVDIMCVCVCVQYF